jgi:ubiquinone/menaquinone biosynthesis C-methylase UbiE
MMTASSIQTFLRHTAVRQAHEVVREVVSPGDVVIDATCGNGRDTAFLAGIVGEGGRVYAFDIQKDALSSTSRQLASLGFTDRVVLIEGSHAAMEAAIREEHRDRVRAVMFNLGYLPGGDHAITTKAEESAAAIRSAARMIAPGGVVTVVVYTGHEGGAEEAEAVHRAVAELDTSDYAVAVVRPLNRSGRAPYLIAIYRCS